MLRGRPETDYEPVTRRARPRPWGAAAAQDGLAPGGVAAEGGPAPSRDSSSPAAPEEKISRSRRWPELKRGHALSFAGLLLFTAVTYFRPYELVAALSGFTSMAFWLAVATLAVFVPTQLSLEGTLSARPREVNLVLLLLLAGLLSIPLAISSSQAWFSWVDFAKVVTMFIVMVNVVRTEGRLRVMLWLGLLVGLVLSVNALGDYSAGNLKLRGDRIAGVLGGLFDNPNDMALHLVTMIPIALGLLFVARGFPKKLIYGLCALLMVAATVVTFSRGGFLGLVCATFVMAWKIGRRSRLKVLLLFAIVAVIFLAVVPSDYSGRLMSILGNPSGEGSATARQNLLFQSIVVTLRHPLLGIGMNNFPNVSAHDQVSHNAYTQVSAEMGVPAMLLYVAFIWFALKRLRAVERETYDSRSDSRVFYLVVGLQASLVGYMVSSFFASVAYLWYIYYLVGYALCLQRLYEAKGAEGVFRRAQRGGRAPAASEAADPAPAALFTHPLAAQHRQ